jgi:DNA primase
MIDPELKERVRESSDIVEIIGQHVKLKRVGTSYRGPCPFHHGKDPNFSVSPTNHTYHCFVCHEKGDVFSFLQKHLGYDFPTALRAVARHSGIDVPEQQDVRRAGPDPREPIWEVLGAAVELFRATLWDDPAGAPARDYLARRAVDRATADRFSLGYATGDAASIRGRFEALGYTDERLAEAGLLIMPESGGDGEAASRPEPRLRFRRRLMFPIFDASSRPVGFGGRLLGPGEPKYLNSSESPVFAKRSLLYGYNWAKLAIRRDGHVLLVEGYFDLLRLVAAGIDAVVAPLGTALTQEQATLLARHTKQVFLVYDSDSAGLKATFRAGDELLRHGLRVRVVTLPDGDDPDTFVAAHGKGAMDAELDRALDVFDRKVQVLERAGWFGDLDRKRTAIDKTLPTIRAAVDPITRSLYVARLSEASGVPEATLLREVADSAPVPAPSTAPVEPPTPQRPATRPTRTAQQPGVSAERALVGTVVVVRSLLDMVAEKIDATALRDPSCRAIFEALLRAGPDATVDELAATLTPEAIALLQTMLADGTMGADPARVIDDSLAHLRVRALRERLDEIERTMRLASDGEKNGLMAEQTRIMAEVRALKGRGFSTYGKSRRRVDH